MNPEILLTTARAYYLAVLESEKARKECEAMRAPAGTACNCKGPAQMREQQADALLNAALAWGDAGWPSAPEADKTERGK